MLLSFSTQARLFLGKHFKKHRESNSITQSQVASSLGYDSPQFVSNFERGICVLPFKDIHTVIKSYKISKEETLRLYLEATEISLNDYLSSSD